MPLKHLSNFWRNFEILLINCESNLILTWSKDCVIINSEGEEKFAITETKLVLKEQLTGTNLNQARKHLRKIDT